MHVRHTGEPFYLCLFLLIFVPSGIFSNNDVRFSIKTYPFTAVHNIAGGDWQTLPIVLQKQINNVTYTMGVTDVYLHPSFIQASVYLSIEIPQQKKSTLFWFS